MRASTIVLIVVWPINLALNVVLVHYTPLGMLGCPVALSITYWLAFILLIIVTWQSPTHKANGTWGGLQPTAVFNAKSCRAFLGLALPGIFMVGTEWYVGHGFDIFRGFSLATPTGQRLRLLHSQLDGWASLPWQDSQSS